MTFSPFIQLLKWLIVSCMHTLDYRIRVNLYKTELNAVRLWHSETKEWNKTSSTLKENASERNKIRWICTNTWRPFFFVWQSKKFYILFLSGVINRLLKCCRQSTLITLISKQIYLSILDFIWFFFCYTYCIVN